MRAGHGTRPLAWRWLRTWRQAGWVRRWLLSRRLRQVADAIERVDRLLAREFGTLDLTPLLHERALLERRQAMLRTRLDRIS